MAEAIITGLVTLIGLAVGIWSGGRFYRERKALNEEMELVENWKEHGDVAQLRAHVDEQLRRYLVRAKHRDHSFRRLLGELLILSSLVFVSFVVIASVAGGLDILGTYEDPDMIWFTILFVLAVIALWRVDQWVQNWWASRGANKLPRAPE